MAGLRAYMIFAALATGALALAWWPVKVMLTMSCIFGCEAYRLGDVAASLGVGVLAACAGFAVLHRLGRGRWPVARFVAFAGLAGWPTAVAIARITAETRLGWAQAGGILALVVYSLGYGLYAWSLKYEGMT